MSRLVSMPSSWVDRPYDERTFVAAQWQLWPSSRRDGSDGDRRVHTSWPHRRNWDPGNNRKGILAWPERHFSTEHQNRHRQILDDLGVRAQTGPLPSTKLHSSILRAGSTKTLLE